MVEIGIHLPGVSDRWATIKFLIDTGAWRSILHPSASIVALGIDREHLNDQRRWPRRSNMIGLGGITQGLIATAEWSLLHAPAAHRPTSKRLVKFERDILLAKPTRENADIPSLLGRDILSRFRLIVDERRRFIALLDDDDIAQGLP